MSSTGTTLLLNANNIVYDMNASARWLAFTYLDDGPHGILKSTVSTNRISPSTKHQRARPGSAPSVACFPPGKIVPDTSVSTHATTSAEVRGD